MKLAKMFRFFSPKLLPDGAAASHNSSSLQLTAIQRDKVVSISASETVIYHCKFQQS